MARKVALKTFVGRGGQVVFEGDEFDYSDADLKLISADLYASPTSKEAKAVIDADAVAAAAEDQRKADEKAASDAALQDAADKVNADAQAAVDKANADAVAASAKATADVDAKAGKGKQ